MGHTVVCEKVSRHYSQGDVIVRALDEVSLLLERGEFIGLCGPSGSGKTTLLNMIAGLDRPDSGDVKVCGEDLSGLSESELSTFRLQKIGFVFQAYNLIPVLSARENVEFVMQLQGVSPRERTKKSDEILEEVGLGGMEHRRPAELSGGQQQRVAVARAIVSEPELVLADEPTANLDSKTAEGLLLLMERLNKERGTTFVFSTHDKLVMDFARRIVRLRDGAIESDEQKAA